MSMRRFPPRPPHGWPAGYILISALAQNAVNSRNGWRIIKALTNHAGLEGFDAATADEILADCQEDKGGQEDVF